jgi:thiamine biosynthesis lipoprotein
MRPDPILNRLDFEALGSNCSLFAMEAGAERLARAADWVRAMHVRLTRFDAGSELSRLNAAAGTWAPVSDELELLLREALRAYDLSGGLVNAAVVPALLALGYSRPLRLGPGAPAEAVGPLPPLPAVLEVVPGRARLEPGAAIDLGGIAKGWLADRLSERIGECCLVNLGGDLYARGGGPSGEGWPVGLGTATVLLRDQGAATSSTRKRSWEVEGRSVHHLVDPRTGRDAQTDLAEVSVVAADATQAEVFAKTALLLGSVDAPVYLAAHCSAWWLN